MEEVKRPRIHPIRKCIKCGLLFSFIKFKKRKQQEMCLKCQNKTHYQTWVSTHQEEKRQYARNRYTKLRSDPEKYRNHIEKNKERNQRDKWKANTPMRRLNVYRCGARRRKIEFELTLKDIEENWNKTCSYCGDMINGVGIDRIENTKGYTKDNIQNCCYLCNVAKNTLSHKEFIELITKIYKKQNLCCN